MRRFPLGAALGQCCGGSVDLLFEPVLPGATWLRAVRDLRDHECVVVTRVAGDADPGKLVVTADRASGTLGSVALDAATIASAREFLSAAQPAALHRVAADEDALVFIEPLLVADFRLVLFGAGHVGRALVRALTGVPCRITWVDERAREFPAEIPAQVRAVVTDAPDEEVDAASSGSYFLVMTHSHALDQQLTERILRRDDFAYFGLIGSATKRRLFERRLAARGVAVERLARMTCPIGVRGINGKEPAVIALAVAAELLQRREAQVQHAEDEFRRRA